MTRPLMIEQPDVMPDEGWREALADSSPQNLRLQFLYGPMFAMAEDLNTIRGVFRATVGHVGTRVTGDPVVGVKIPLAG